MKSRLESDERLAFAERFLKYLSKGNINFGAYQRNLIMKNDPEDNFIVRGQYDIFGFEYGKVYVVSYDDGIIGIVFHHPDMGWFGIKHHALKDEDNPIYKYFTYPATGSEGQVAEIAILDMSDKEVNYYLVSISQLLYEIQKQRHIEDVVMLVAKHLPTHPKVDAMIEDSILIIDNEEEYNGRRVVVGYLDEKKEPCVITLGIFFNKEDTSISYITLYVSRYGSVAYRNKNGNITVHSKSLKIKNIEDRKEILFELLSRIGVQYIS